MRQRYTVVVLRGNPRRELTLPSATELQAVAVGRKLLINRANKRSGDLVTVYSATGKAVWEGTLDQRGKAEERWW